MPLKKTTTKSVSPEKNAKVNSATANAKVSKSSTGTGVTMKMTVTNSPTMTRLHPRKVLRLSGKRPGAHHHHHGAHRTGHGLGMTGKGRPLARQTNLEQNQCDNSDDSGLGFEHHMDTRPLQYTDRNIWVENIPDLKRRKTELKVENDDTNDGYCFPDTLKNCKENNAIIRTLPCSPIQNITRTVSQNNGASKNINRCLPLVSRRAPVTGPITLTTQLSSTSRNGKIHLQIMCQPEQQHRARYQTEGSRGAVKDRTGNGFPIVKLIGYDKPATLQIFIGTDLGRVAPHMFYQACRVSGKNSTPCIEKKIDGTIVIEVELEPSKDMIATCDCVGILKERNVDVEHRFPEQLSPRSKKKSTKCRMVFRAAITNDDGSTETLQVCSQPIVCTQPPGVPEICKKSLTTCPAAGGLELFILGKNFLKDTKVVFQQQNAYDSPDRSEVIWQETVIPDKEYLQQTHLVCVVPAFRCQDILEPIQIRLFVTSSGKNSEPHTFVYTPIGNPSTVQQQQPPSVGVGGATNITPPPNVVTNNQSVTVTNNPVTQNAASFPLSKMLWPTGTPKQEMDLGMMPPPTSLVPLAQRRPSTNLTIETMNNSPPMRSMMDSNSPPMRSLKTELIDENSQGSVHMDHIMNENSIDMRHRFRAISESTMDVHHDDSTNMTMINENSMEILQQQQQQEIINAINDNSNSVHSFHEKSNHSIHDDSMDTSRPETRIFAVNPLLNHPMIETPNLTTNDLKGVDLRMKSSTLAATTLNDLANTQSPSLATLHKFVVTEATNMPLPTQTGQSVENFLTTLENNNTNQKVGPVTTLANTPLKAENDLILQQMKSSMIDGAPILSSQFGNSTTAALNQLLPSSETGTKLFNEQVINNTQVLTETLLAANESHIANPNMIQSSVIFSQTQPNPILEQVALTTTVDNHIGSPIKSPKQELLTSPQDIRRSPILQTEILPDNLCPQTTLLNTELPTYPTQTEIVPPEVILNSQVAPSLLQGMCQQTEILTDSTNHLTPVSVESIVVMHAAVDYLETRKKINEITQMDNHMLPSVEQQKSQEMLNTLLDVQNTHTQQTNQVLLQNQVTDLLKMSQNQFTTNQQLLTTMPQENNNNSKITDSVQNGVQTPTITNQTEMKKNEEGMILPALANMSENDLISYINPSCFDQV